MDNNTLKDNSQTNTPPADASSLTPSTPPVSAPADSAPLPAPTPEPAAPTTNPVPINEVEEAPPVDPIPLVDAGTTVPNTYPPAATTSPLDDTTSRRSPILNPAPAKNQKLDPKYIIPIAILGILVLGLGIYLIVDKVALEPQALESARKAAAASATPSISNDTDIDTVDDTSDEPILISYSNKDSLSGTDTYLLTSIDNAPGVSVTSNDTSTVAEFTIDWAKAKEAYSDIKTASGNSTYTIDFGQGLSEIFYGLIGDNGFYLFLLDDGTVDYLDIHQALANKSFTASGPIEGVENVIKFLDATASDKSATILAQQATSEYYDLATFLK